jgi:hypothetical protein
MAEPSRIDHPPRGTLHADDAITHSRYGANGTQDLSASPKSIGLIVTKLLSRDESET